jgi:hypothetical protein
MGGITFTPGATQLGWSTLGATLLQGEVFTNDCTALVIASGWWENTGQVWTDTNKVSVGNQWGRSPVLTEVVPFTLTLPVGTNHVSVWSLDERGQRKAAIPVSGNSSSTTITITTNAGSIWYELRVARWMASFDLWRARYFSSEELLDLNLSGAGAAPDGDRVANLWKYYLGLPAKAPAPANRLPLAGLWNQGDQRFLSITYSCDKLANDVICTPQVSLDLLAWFSGPAYARIERVVDQGVLQEVTVRALNPVSSGPDHSFLRLQLERQ